MLKRLKIWIDDHKNQTKQIIERPISEVSRLQSNYYVINTNVRLSAVIASISDIPAMITVQEACYDGIAPWHRQVLLNEMINNPNAIFIVMYNQQEPIAFIGAWVKNKECHITNIATIPSYERLGVGTFLMTEIEQIAQQQQSEKITLEVRLSNQTAQSLYRTLGFESIKIKPHYYSDNDEDALSMVNYLGVKK